MNHGNTEREESSSEQQDSSDSSSEESEEPSSKVQRKDKWLRDSEGFPYFELSNTRRVTVRKFSGKLLVDIREFYKSDNGTMAPGRKGISLSIEQYEKLKAHLSDIDEAIQRVA